MFVRARILAPFVSLALMQLFAVQGAPAQEKAAEAKPDPQAILKTFAAKDTKPAERRAVCDQLAELGDEAVGPVMATYSAGGLHEEQVRELIRLLGRIGTKKAAAALQRIVRMRGEPAHWAMAALAPLDHREVHSFLLAYKPKNDDEMQIHVRALERVPGSRATGLVVDALGSANSRISARARQVLGHRIARGEEADDELEDFLKNLRDKEAKEVAAHAVTNALEVCAALPDNDGLDALADCLAARGAHIRAPAMAVLARHPQLVRDRVIRDALADALAERPGKEELLHMLQAFRKSGEKQALPLAAACLDQSDREVYLLACDAMTALTGKNVGRNPEKWKEWYKENR